MKTRPIWVLAAIVLAAPGLVAAVEEAVPSSRGGDDVRPTREETVRFNRDIRPIMSDICWRCHGPATRKAGLRLDVREEAIKPTKSGAVPIVPGNPEESDIIERIFSDDETEIMPPPDSHKTLSPEQKDLFRRWVAQGAEFEPHWSLAPLERPALPEPPPIQAPLRNPVDHFVQARLAREHIAAAPEADRHTLIRRLTLDLTGLPPTPEEVAAFVNDRASDAYEKAVARLLASPRFAEKQAIYWLDAVRYADTVGFHGDQAVSLWPYRDYVLRAIHANMPFDQFTREQLAGDLLPDATDAQRAASAFNRLNRISTEGGVQDKEYRAKYAADRVRTVAAVWLGATLGCAECHNHKYDPFTSRDFYSLAAFFADVKEKGFYDGGFSQGDWGPRLALPTPDQKQALAALDAALSQVRDQAKAASDDQLAPERQAWECRTRELDAAKQLGWQALKPASAGSAHGAVLNIHEDGLVTADGPNPDHETYTVSFEPPSGHWTALLLRTTVDEELPGNRFGRGWISLVLSDLELEVAAPGCAPRPVEFSEAISDGKGQGQRFPAWAAIDGDPATGWGFEFAHSQEHKLLVRFRQPLDTTEGTMLTLRLRQESEIRRATIGRFKVALTRVEGATLDDDALPKSVLEALRAEPESLDDDQKSQLAAQFRVAAPELEPLRRREAELNGRRTLLMGRIPTVLVTEVTSELREVRVLPRGNWMDDSGPVVEPAVPAVLGKLDALDRRATRLDLARWLASPQNPSVARAFVNRMWKQFFGSGLSRVLDDLGSQGEAPANLDLLDWLAAEFIEPQWQAAETHTWDLKHLVFVIVTSHTYRQTSAPRPELTARDPDNQLLARQNAVRLDAEIIRDNALAISGLLRERFGGPSVFPVQPDGYWAALNFPKREYAASYGDDLYRRSLYTHWQRTFLHPSLLAFDACTREESVLNRPNSNTPLQAMVLLNDPIYHETARGFAELILRRGGSSLDTRLDWAFVRAVSRPPTAEEQEILARLYAMRLTDFEEHPDAARDFLAVGEVPIPGDLPAAQLAAMTAVARAILNLHETITRN